MGLNADLLVHQAKSIISAVSHLEGMEMVRHAERALDRPVIVEIGSYLGCSSVILGSVAQSKAGRLVMIDPFYETSIEECEKNLSHFKIHEYNILKGKSHDVIDRVPAEIDVLFIDGDHHYDGVKLDCEDYIPRVKVGGVIMFHDYNSSWVGVRKAVDEVEGIHHVGLVDSLLISEKL